MVESGDFGIFTANDLLYPIFRLMNYYSTVFFLNLKEFNKNFFLKIFFCWSYKEMLF